MKTIIIIVVCVFLYIVFMRRRYYRDFVKRNRDIKNTRYMK